MEPVVNLTCPCGHTNKYFSDTALEAQGNSGQLLVCISCAEAQQLNKFKESSNTQNLTEFKEIFKYENRNN